MPAVAENPDVARFKQGKELFDKGRLQEALEKLEPLATKEEWRASVRPMLVAIVTALRARLPKDAAFLDRVERVANRINMRGAEPKRDMPWERTTEEPFDLSFPNSVDSPQVEGIEDARRGTRPGRRRSEPTFGKRSDSTSETIRPRLSGNAPVFSASIERTPHLRIDAERPIRAGSRFTASVYLDSLPSLQGETAEILSAAAGSRVEVTLSASGHFRVEDSPTARFVLDPSVNRIDVGSFGIRVVDTLKDSDGPPFLAAVFYVDGRSCGRVTRSVEVEGVAVGTPAGEPGVAVIGSNGLPPADLTVTIVAAPTNDGRSFVCTVQSPHLPAYRDRVTSPWNLQSTTRDLIGGFMRRFMSQDAGSPELIAELKGAGNTLFEAAPQIFQDAFWALIDASLPLRTISVVTAEPFVPWELMIPTRWKNDIYEERQPLGVEFLFGRWTDTRVISPPRTISLRDSFVIAPTYEGKKLLKNSDTEAAMVLTRYAGERITPATFARIEERLGSQARTLIHFICHGEDDGSGIQSLLLEGGKQLSSTGILGMSGLAALFRTKRPVVFLNACKVGQTVPSLVGLGGFVSSFIRLGATAVIAPLWSVEDGTAHEIAREFYARLAATPSMPFAEIFALIRAKAYHKNTGRDTYAAYCFYGDPYATLLAG